MCLAWMRPAGAAAIPQSYLDSAVSKNPDGFGFAYTDGGLLRVERFLPGGRKAFVARYREVEKRGDTVIGHARLATHGSRTLANTHPYVYTDPAGFEVAVAHNGIIRIKASGDESDTAMFVRLVLAHLPSRWWKQPALMYLVSEALGYGNKLVMLTAEGESVIVNADAGVERSGTWYSNAYSLPYAAPGKRPVGSWFPSPRAATRRTAKRGRREATDASEAAVQATSVALCAIDALPF